MLSCWPHAALKASEQTACHGLRSMAGKNCNAAVRASPALAVLEKQLQHALAVLGVRQGDAHSGPAKTHNFASGKVLQRQAICCCLTQSGEVTRWYPQAVITQQYLVAECLRPLKRTGSRMLMVAKIMLGPGSLLSRQTRPPSLSRLLRSQNCGRKPSTS